MAPAMVGIPPVHESDAEDVAWALQTAEALWKRSERVDAIVWLRRAAQAAGEAEDDDRALALARGAAELAEWIARESRAPSMLRSPPPAAPSIEPENAEAIDDLLRTSQTDEALMSVEEDVLSEPPSRITLEPALHEEPTKPLPLPRPSLPPPRLPPIRSSPRPPRPPPLSSALPPPRPPLETLVDSEEPTNDSASVVPTAAEKHAGMLDPWADPGAPAQGRGPDEAGPWAVSRAPFDPEEVVTSAPPVVPFAPNRPAATRSVLFSPLVVPSTPASRPAAAAPALDLSRVEAFTDLPYDVRVALAHAAAVTELARDEEVSGFALALVLEGTVDVAATIVDAPARRLGQGAVMRARGTIEHVEPVRIIGGAGVARIATWDDAAVAEAFRSCPWVEDDLRASGNRLQAEVGVTLGPLGERLDLALRTSVLGKLSLRALAEGELFVTRGASIPGLLVVGAGELQLLDEGDVPAPVKLRSGDFLFPSEVLRAAPAPATVRAAKGGALILFAERGVAQELLVSCPPLLEIFASG